MIVAAPGAFGDTDIVFDDRVDLFDLLRERRGWTRERLAALNDATHEELKDLSLLCAKLHSIREAGQKIVVLPDFDMDGVTSGVLGWAGLAELGFDVELYVPDHRRGHDISKEAVDELLTLFPDAKAVITCDGGINSWDGIQYGKDRGLLMLVTDHHVELPPGCNADVAVNPGRLDEDYANKGICGAHVFYQVLRGYAERYAPEKTDTIGLLKLFAGIGTISDVMPLHFENRPLVRDSLSIARLCWVNLPPEDRATEYDIENSLLITLLRYGDHSEQFVSAFEGFALVLRQFREIRKLRTRNDLTEEFYGFYLSPAFNAIRRVDADMHDAFGAFTAEGKESKIEHINAVLEASELRKELTEKHMEALEERDQPYMPLIALTDAPGGMLGLLANKLMHASGVPALVLSQNSDGGFSGSARAPFWYPVVESLTAAGFRAVGHEQACGVGAADEDHLVELYEHLQSSIAYYYQKAKDSGALVEAEKADLVLGPSQDCDADYDDLDELKELAVALENLAPYGHGFERPEFEFVVNLAETSIKVIGSEESHLRLVLPTGLKLLWWNAVDHLDDLIERAQSPIPSDSVVRLKVGLSLNYFRGETTVQAMVNGMIAAEETDIIAFTGDD